MQRPTQTFRPSKVAFRLQVKANPGAFEHILVESYEEYTVDAATDIAALRKHMASVAAKEVQAAVIEQLNALVVTGTGPHPAGPIAVHLYDKGIE